jgi:hypothetical protein
VSYTTLTDDELINALRMAGRKPERELIQACLERRESLTPILLSLVLGADDDDWDDWEEGDDDWDADDPRGYIDIHAGLLLIAFREPAAIPHFIEILINSWYESLKDWFSPHLHHYGPLLVPTLIAVIDDEDASIESRITAIEILTNTASRFPEIRQQAIKTLRSLLPPLKDDGLEVDDPSEDDVDLWTWAADGLGDLGDRHSLPVVEALHEAELIDEFVYGDFDDYKREFFSPKGFRVHHRKQAFDIFKAYGYED